MTDLEFEKLFLETKEIYNEIDKINKLNNMLYTKIEDSLKSLSQEVGC